MITKSTSRDNWEHKSKKEKTLCVLVGIFFFIMVALFAIDIFIGWAGGRRLAFIFAALGTLLQAFLYMRRDKLVAFLQLATAIAFAVFVLF